MAVTGGQGETGDPASQTVVLPSHGRPECRTPVGEYRQVTHGQRVARHVRRQGVHAAPGIYVEGTEPGPDDLKGQHSGDRTRGRSTCLQAARKRDSLYAPRRPVDVVERRPIVTPGRLH